MNAEMACGPRFVLGTVQFGLDYGVSNVVGRPSQEEVQRILETAKDSGIDILDTAAGYGNAEEVLGSLAITSGFDVITKTSPIQTASIDASVVDKLGKIFDRSLARLRRDSVAGILVHQSADLLKPGADRLYRMLSDWKNAGLVRRIGVSIYAPDEAASIISRYPVDLVQLPFNVLDQRALHSGLLDTLLEADVEVHARSVFLQGALLMSPAVLPPHLSSMRLSLSKLNQDCSARGWTVQEACLRFVLGVSGIDKLVCGVNSVKELRELVHSARPDSAGIEFDFSSFSLNDTRIIHPSEWPR